MSSAFSSTPLYFPEQIYDPSNESPGAPQTIAAAVFSLSKNRESDFVRG